MKIVIAMDSFRGSIDADAASAAIRRGLLKADPDLNIVLKPMADGGEGTARAMMTALNGTWVPSTVMGPLPDRQVDGGYVWFEDRHEALVEMAVASGLPLLNREDYNPLKTTTYGAGQLLGRALARNPARALLTVGGSATVDGGVGLARALGWRFLDRDGREVGQGGGELIRIAELVPPAEEFFPPVEVLCDVQNPLLGERGAARVFAPQKGATPEMVDQLEEGLSHLCARVKEVLGLDMDVAGGGAAGGLSAGARVFLGAELVPGIRTVMEACGLQASMAEADWVITGEGSFDHQSLMGKVVSGVAGPAREAGVPVAVLAGRVGLPVEEHQAAGIRDAIAIRPPEMPLEYAMEHAGELLEAAAETWARNLRSTS
ncbi:MAG: glycerate kinase [Verrucomicrobiota bacterium]